MWLFSAVFILVHLSGQLADSVLSINELPQENLCRVREMKVTWNLCLCPLGSVLDRV